jgi:alanine racemase
VIAPASAAVTAPTTAPAAITGPRARIDLSALAHNLGVARRLAPHSRICAVVKADAYGHGMVAVARALQGADGLAVARVSEAIALREAGIARPLLVLEGAGSREELLAAVRHGIQMAVHREGQVAWVEECAGLADRAPLGLWVKVETGMHRLGLDPGAVPDVLERLGACRGARVRGLMTHLANADTPEDPLSEGQCRRLQAVGAGRGLALSIANSAGLLAVAASRTDWVRPGIMLYGASPLSGQSAADLGLRPVMTLVTELIAVQALRRGDAIGYGGTWQCPEDMSVGIAAVGYADGYPRHAPHGTPVLVRGCPCSLVGRVSMDMIHVDLRPLPDARPGDPVTLWGEGLPVEEVAGRAGTISYELLCRVTYRVPREQVGA